MLSMRPSGEKHVDIDFLNFTHYTLPAGHPSKGVLSGFIFHFKSMSSYLI